VRPSLARAVRTPEDILRRLARLVALYHDHKRLFELRAARLWRLFAEAELQLEAIHHPVDAATGLALAPPAPSAADCAFRFVRLAPHPAERIRAPP
jgi:hypothetical protein